MPLSTKENTNFCTKMLFWQIYVTRKNKMYVGLHVNCPIFLLFIFQFQVPWKIFLKVSSIKFHRNVSSWSCTNPYWLTDRWTDRQGKANGLFCSYAKVHKNRWIISLESTLGKIIFRHCSYSVKSATVMDTCFYIGIFDWTEMHTCRNVEDCFLLHLSFYFISWFWHVNLC